MLVQKSNVLFHLFTKQLLIADMGHTESEKNNNNSGSGLMEPTAPIKTVIKGPRNTASRIIQTQKRGLEWAPSSESLGVGGRICTSNSLMVMLLLM